MKCELINCPVEATYQKYSHLDKLLGDETWLLGDEKDGNHLKRVAYESWLSIRDHHINGHTN